MASARFQQVKACVFDAYGTLFDVHSAAAGVADQLGESAQALSQLWRQKQLEYTWLRSLMGAHCDFWQVTGEALDFAMAAHGLHEPALKQRLMELYLTLDAHPDVTPTLSRLKDAGMATAILSNGEPKMLQAAVESAGIGGLLDQVLSIEDVGIYKPDHRTYQLAVDRLAVGEPAEIAFVSTNAWDARGAAHFGFTVAWMNRFGMQMDVLPGEPAKIIQGLPELTDALGLQ